MEKNNLSLVVLQNIFIDYMYIFDNENNTRRQICSQLETSIQEQRRIDRTSKVKRK